MIRDFMFKMFSKPVVPMFMWIKLVVFLILPSLLYVYGWWILLILIPIFVVSFLFFPEKLIKVNETTFMYNVQKGILAEFDDNVEFVTPAYKKCFDARWKKIACYIIFTIHSIIALAFCANGHLIIGSILYYPSFMSIMRILIEYRDAALLLKPSIHTEEV